MKKKKIIAITVLSVITMGFTLHQTEALNKLKQATKADVEVKAQVVDKNKPSEIIELAKEIPVKEDKKTEEVNKKEEAATKEVQEVESTKEPVQVKEEVKKIEETFDYVWAKENFGTIQENTIEDPNQEEGYRKIQEGSLGQKEIQIKITYHDGVEVSRTDTGEEKTISNPVNTKIIVGTKVKVVDDGNYQRNDASQVLNFINEYRSSKGLAKYQPSQKLNAYADIRAKESTVKFSHTRPNGNAWHTVGNGVLAENLAYGYYPQGTVDAWIESPGHNEILLRDNVYAGVSVYLGPDGSNYAVLLTGN